MFLLRPSIQSLLCIRFKGKKVFIIHLLFSKVVLRLHFLFLPFEFFWLGMGDPCGLYGEKRSFSCPFPAQRSTLLVFWSIKFICLLTFLGK